MSSLKERISVLEHDLCARPMCHYSYHDLPFAVFCYPPHLEWEMRREIRLLRTRIANHTDRQVEVISLADLLWQAIEDSEGISVLSELESREGFGAAQRQVQDYLSDADWQPLPGLLADRMAKLDENQHLVFLTRAGALSPNVYRVSKLLDEMKGRTLVPSVLFLPATTDGGAGLRYMGISENEGRGSYHTKVYLEG